MHEFSVAMGIANEVASHNKKVVKIILELGELTMISPEQLKFAYEIITKNSIIQGSILEFVTGLAEYKCKYCNSSGKIKLPVFACPKCGKEIKITGGRQCVIKKIIFK